MNSSERERRAVQAKAAFEFLADFHPPAVGAMSASATRRAIVLDDAVVAESVTALLNSAQRRTLMETVRYRRSIFPSSEMLDAGYGRRERVFANVYDALLVQVKFQGDDVGTQMYRGQYDSRWRLEASYYRARPAARRQPEHRAAVISSFYGVFERDPDELDAGDLRRLEQETLSRHRYLALDGLSPLQREAVIQHYTSGTKLLDFTRNAFVAAYFATCPPANSKSADMGAIYRIAPRELEELPFGIVEAPELPPAFRRIHRQDGIFLKIRFEGALNDPGLWARWVFFHTELANPFECSAYGVTARDLFPLTAHSM
jgi:hypothetical protein